MTLASQLAEDLAPAFQADMLGRDLFYNGEPATGIFSELANPDPRPRSADSMAATSVLRIMKSAVPSPKYRDTVEIDGVTWRVISVISSTRTAWKLSLERDRRPVI